MIAPPHGRNPRVFDGPCDCDACNQYHRWEAVAEELGTDYDGLHCPACGKPFVWTGREREGQRCPECRYGD